MVTIENQINNMNNKKENKFKRESALEFIANHKHTYFKWIAKNCDDFPYCCTLSSEILGSYINAKFEAEPILIHGWFEPWNKEMQGWDYRYDIYTNPFHAWLKIDEHIIDFTSIQFSDDIPCECIEDVNEEWLYDIHNITKREREFKSTPSRIFNNCFKYSYLHSGSEIKDVIVSKKTKFMWRYYPNKKYQCNRFKKIALKSNSFEEYLNNVADSKQFKNYKYNKGLRLYK